MASDNLFARNDHADTQTTGLAAGEEARAAGAVRRTAARRGLTRLYGTNGLFKRDHRSIGFDHRKTPLRGAFLQAILQILSSWSAVLDYCTAVMAHEQREQFRILFLDKKNALIADEVQGRGTVDHTPVYPREVVRRALELNATALILVHNHPSGDPSPSRADIEMTRTIEDTAKPLGISLHDHVIIGKNAHASLRGLKMM